MRCCVMLGWPRLGARFPCSAERHENWRTHAARRSTRTRSSTMMNHGEVNSFNTFRDIVHRFRSSAWVFRGVSDVQYSLTPKVGRIPLAPEREHSLFSAFCRGAVAFRALPESLMERLALAQHHG